MANQINDEMLAGLWDEQSSSSESDLEDSDLDGDYQPPTNHSSCEESEESDSENDGAITSDDESECDEETPGCSMEVDEEHNVFEWTKNLNNFRPKMSLPSVVDPIVLADVDRSTNELDTFLELFPLELFEKIAHYTNMRLEIQKSDKKKQKHLLFG